MLYDFTLNPSDRRIIEAVIINEINIAHPSYNITDAYREDNILKLETDQTLDATQQDNINTIIINHDPDNWGDTTTGTPSGPENPVVCEDDIRLSDSRDPNPHASSHINGIDNIPEATSTTSGLMSISHVSKLNEIEVTAQVNVQSDWDESDITSDAFIKNKPSIPSNHSDLNLDDGTNPHGTTKSDVGLNNVDNTSDSEKPISNLVQSALDNKEDVFIKYSAFNKNFGSTAQTVVEGNDPRLQPTTNTQNGLFTSEEQDKLESIEQGAQVNVQSDWDESDITSDAFIKNKPALIINHSELNLDDGSNPHGTTKLDLGLENVDNTRDINKSVSILQQLAIDSAETNANTYTDNKITSLKGTPPITLDTLEKLADVLGDDPNTISNINVALDNRVRYDIDNQSLNTIEQTNAKTNIGLENVDNTSDLDKPISTSTQTALDLKEDAFDKKGGFNRDFGTTVGTVVQGNDPRLSDSRDPNSHAITHTNGTDDIQDATSSQKGLMSATQAAKLDGIESGANVTDFANVDNAGAVMNTDTSTAEMNFVIDEDDFSSNSDTKVPTQQSVKAYINLNHDYTRSSWPDVTDNRSAISQALDYIEDTQGSGRITPTGDSLLLTGLNSFRVYAGNGYISYSGFHKKITWSQIDIDTTGWSEDNYYVYVDSTGSVLTSTIKPNDFQNIMLGSVYYGGTQIGTYTSSGSVIANGAISRMIEYMTKLGIFISDAGGRIQLISGETTKIVSTACTVQQSLRPVSLSEIDSNDTGTKFFAFHHSGDYNWVRDNYWEDTNGIYGGGIPLDIINDYNANWITTASGACSFTNGSDIVTSATNLTSEISVGDRICRNTDSYTFYVPVKSISWSGTQTEVVLESNYQGTTGSDTTLIDKTLPKISTGKYAKHVIFRDTSDRMYLIYGQEEYDTLEDAINGGLPKSPDSLKNAQINMATLIVGEGLTTLDTIIDIRPLPFHSRDGGGSGATSSNDHGELVGLGDDDHTQYLLANATRDLTAVLAYASDYSFTDDKHIVAKKYVDTLINTHTHAQLHDKLHTIVSHTDTTATGAELDELTGGGQTILHSHEVTSQDLNDAGAVMESDTSTANMSFVIDEDDFSSNSDTKVPTQQSVKAYIDSSITSTEIYQTIWAEENGGLNANNREWSFGNGSTGTCNVYPLNNGEIRKVFISAESTGTSVEIQIMVNNVIAGSGTFTANGVVDLATPITVLATDELGFRTGAISGTWHDVRVGFGIAIALEGLKGPKGDPGTGSSIAIQKDNSTIDSTCDTLNFEGIGVNTVVNEGTGKTTVTITGETFPNRNELLLITDGDHDIRTDNPHGVNATDIGLGNVDNTSDMDKPISTLQQTALNNKEDSFTKNTAFNKDFGTSAGNVVEGNDSRLYTTFRYYADQLDYPRGDDWAINVGAPAARDADFTSLTVRRFDDSESEGVGFTSVIPGVGSNLKIKIKSKAVTAPTSTQTVFWRLYMRKFPNNGVSSGWLSLDLPLQTIPNNTYCQYFEYETTLSSWGLDLNTLTQFELVRVGSDSNDTLIGDLALLVVEMEIR